MHQEICNIELTLSLLSGKWIACILTIIGGLNWGLVGAFHFDLVAAIFGDMSALSRIIYVIVGLSALYLYRNEVRKSTLLINKRHFK